MKVCSASFPYKTKSSFLFLLSIEQYTVREVRIHVRHVNELIHSCDLIDLYNGNNGYSLSVVNEITNGDLPTNTGRRIEISSHSMSLFGF